MTKEKVTAIIPTFNEQIHIEDAIQSVSFADEILVIDSFSTDQTVELAKKYPVKVIQRVFDDFSSQKNFAIEKAKYNWIYILDADERVSDNLKDEILKALDDPLDFVGFYINRSFYYFGKKINYGGYQRDKVLRLFRKDRCRYNGDLVHERIKFNGKTGKFINKIEHYSYQSYEHFNYKLDHYASLRALSLFRKKKSISFFHLRIKPPVRFFIDYFLRLGVLDGKPGIILAKHQYRGVKSRYINLKKLYDQQKISTNKVN